jgi:hypothetical protein
LKRRLFPPKGGEEYVCQAEALRSKGSSVHPSEGGKRLCCAPRTERKAPGWTGRHESAFCCSSQFKRPRNGACGCGRASDRVVQRWRCERRDVALISPVGYDLVARRKRRLASCRTEMASSFSASAWSQPIRGSTTCWIRFCCTSQTQIDPMSHRDGCRRLHSDQSRLLEEIFCRTLRIERSRPVPRLLA